MKYITCQDDMVDDICWGFYGAHGMTGAVYAANPGLADWGPRLPIGLSIELPQGAPKTNATVKLWD